MEKNMKKSVYICITETLSSTAERSTILQIKYTFSFFFFKGKKKWCQRIIDFSSILSTLVLIFSWQCEVSSFYAVSSKLWSVIWTPLSTLLLDFLFIDLQDLCVCVLSCQVVFNSLWCNELYHQALQSVVFSRQKYCSGLPFPSPGNPPDQGIEPTSPVSSALSDSSTEPPGRISRISRKTLILYLDLKIGL